MEFENKTALVSGAAGSIGRGVAERLVAEGARVFITDLDQAKLDEICAAVGERCRGLAADITSPEQVQAESLREAERSSFIPESDGFGL